jgi:putative oxidoreductase
MEKIILWTMHESPALQQLGLAIIRISFGVVFLIFGYQKLLSGSEHLTQIGSAMGLFGITRGYMLWGYLAALTELCGGLAFATGFCTRIAALPLIWFLIVALRFHLQKADPFTSWAFACICLCIVIGFLLAGSGMYSIDHYLTSSAAQGSEYM